MAMGPSSRRLAPDNGDIALRRAAHDATGGIYLGSALCAEPLCLEQVRRLSWKPPRTREALAKKMARRYFPRGKNRHAAMLDLLLRAAEAVATRRAAGGDVDRQNAGAAICFRSVGTFAYFVDGESSPGDPQRRAKAGSVHDRSFALAVGAALVVRRGVCKCLTTRYALSEAGLLTLESECRAKSGPNGYCRLCATDDALAHDRDARRKLIEATINHAPRLGGNARGRRLRRSRPL